MKVIDISKEKFLNLLLNSYPFDQGQFGIITLVNDKLYKVYYKDFINTYIGKNASKLDFEVDIRLKVKEESNSELMSPNSRLEDFSRLSQTKSYDLITGILSYKGLFIGIEMTYYDGYITLFEAAKIVSDEELDRYINISYDLANDLLIHDIVPNDISEKNILINIETGDVKLIDLDGIETTYGPKNYVRDYPYNVESINKKFSEMIHRLKSNKQKIRR